jgi:amino acid transporter
MARGVRGSAVQVVAGVVLIIAATVLPWATLMESHPRVTAVFRGGPLSGLLVGFGVASVGLSLLWFVRESTALHRVHAVVGCAALVTSIALALDKISLANRVASFQESGGQTSYAFGSGVAILASATIVATSFIGLGNAIVASRKRNARPGDSTALSGR